ncbi:PQQ-binding-like beta-propeller repeat protein [Dactylosporangium sp. NPDC051541]|uniref:outer membrane protein assembly factor BamB family protein n=1 Tax=Dactylosporangium sp. NPDC051541 TaxID=3363977 RepID=UPI0037A1C1BB
MGVAVMRVRGLQFVAVGAVLAAVVAVPAAPAAAAGTGWWATSGYLVTNSSFNPNEPNLTVPNVPNLKLKYTGSPARTGQHAPVVAAGLVYTPDDAGVTATDEATGAVKWRFAPDPALYETPAPLIHEAGQLIVVMNIVPQSGGSEGSRIFVLNAATGAVIRDFDSEGGFTTETLLDKGVLVVSSLSRYYAHTRAFRLADGQLLWKNAMHMKQAVSAGGRVLVSGYQANAGTNPKSSVVDLLTGTVLSTSPDWQEYRPLAADESGSKFYVAWGHSLQILDATTGKLTWLASNLSPKYVVLSPTRLYVTSFSGVVTAVNRTTGATIWSRSIPGSENQRAIIAGGVLYVTATGDRVHTLNPIDGTPLNAPSFTGTVDQLVVTYGRVYTTDGTRLSVYGL